jgi:hypothetical protein
MKRTQANSAAISHKIGENRWVVRGPSHVAAKTSKRFDRALAPVAARAREGFAAIQKH